MQEIRTSKGRAQKVHQELVQKGFMEKFSDLPPDQQQVINEAEALHYHPWKAVFKEDSISTPVRLVVDPTMTGLNLILAKGENRLGVTSNIIIRNRTKPKAWSSDISKLYNQLKLDNSALPYSLFLFHSSLDPEQEPEMWVMKVAWYGVTSTGAQAGYALETLAHLGEKSHPKGARCLLEDRFVDDLLPGTDTDQDRDEEIRETKYLLALGGFESKFVVKSGEDPCDKASADGISVNMLGYRWNTKEDTLQPGIGELNFNSKIRGAKNPNSKPIIKLDDARDLVKEIKLTKKHVVSKLAEFYDPAGFFECYKLQLKLNLTRLNQFDWDTVIPDHEQIFWKETLAQFVEYAKVKIPRCATPADAESNSHIRLICLSDAAEFAGGAVVYAGRRLRPGLWSCSLLMQTDAGYHTSK